MAKKKNARAKKERPPARRKAVTRKKRDAAATLAGMLKPSAKAAAAIVATDWSKESLRLIVDSEWKELQAKVDGLSSWAAADATKHVATQLAAVFTRQSEVDAQLEVLQGLPAQVEHLDDDVSRHQKRLDHLAENGIDVVDRVAALDQRIDDLIAVLGLVNQALTKAQVRVEQLDARWVAIEAIGREINAAAAGPARPLADVRADAKAEADASERDQ